MADPLGTLGTAVGVVSLGLQLYGGISSYLNALEGRKEEISSVRRTLENFRSNLSILDGTVVKLQQSHQPASGNAQSNLASCHDELKAMDDLLGKLQDSATPVMDLKGKVKEHVKRLNFPFRREKLRIMQAQLERANTQLQTALQALGLQVSTAVNDVVIDIQKGSQAIASDMRLVRSDLSVVQQTTTTSHIAVQEIKQHTSALGPLIETNSARSSAEVATNMQIILEHLERLERTTSILLPEQSNYLDASNIRRGRLNQLTPSQMVLCRAVSKPSYCRDLCDEIKNAQNSKLTHEGSVPFADITIEPPKPRALARLVRCNCPIRRTRRKQLRGWEFFSIYQETVQVRHVQGCQFASNDLGFQTQEWGLIFRGLHRFVSRIIQVSLQRTTGAGGFSLSHDLAAYPVVDINVAPAFRIVNLLSNAQEEAFEVVPRLTELASLRIARLYQDKKASPLDLSTDGSSLVNALTHVVTICKWSAKPFPGERLFGKLLDLGVPGDRVDSSYRLIPIDKLLQECWDDSWTHGIIELLYQHTGIPSTFLFPYSNTSRPYFFLGSFMQFRVQSLGSHQFQEAIGLSPLARAICRDDLDSVRRLLLHDSTLIKETNVYNQRPLHLGTISAECLGLIFNTFPDASDIIYEYDNFGKTSLFYALWWSSYRCCNESVYSPCVNCDCYQPVQVLLNHGCIVDINEISLFMDALGSMGFEASFRAMALALDHLADRRRTLEDLARTCLSQASLNSCSLVPGQILDSQAGCVPERLVNEGYKIPMALNISVRPDHLYGGSVYCYVSSDFWAQQLFERNFLDINISEPRTPIMLAISGIRHSSQFSYISWLIDKGADLFASYPSSLFPSGPATSGAHVLLGKMGALIGRDTPFTRFLWRGRDQESWAPGSREELVCSDLTNLIRIGCNAEVTDESRCDCVEISGRPFTALLQGALGEDTGLVSPSHVAVYLARFVETFELERIEGARTMTLRYITFRALHLRHRVCRGGRDYDMYWGAIMMDSDEAEQIRGEDADSLRRLEDLLVYFEERHAENPVSLADFLKDVWAPHMDEILRQLNERVLSQDEVRSIEEVGVVWHGQVVKESEEEPDEETESASDERTTLEYWIRRLDEIVPEYAGLE